MYQRLAESLSSSGAFEEALEWYEKAVKENPEPNTLFGFGFTALKAGYPKTAIKQLTEPEGNGSRLFFALQASGQQL